MIALATLVGSIAPAFALPQLLIDMRTNEVLYQNDAGAPWHPASLTKLMTALIAFEAIETGQASLSTPVISSANALSVPPSKMGFPEGTAITLEDALYLLIVKSANDIAVAIGETIAGSEPAFVQMMNARAAMMGLTGTHFVNPHGLHDPAQVTTARDIAMIALTIKARFPQYDSMFSTRTVAFGESRSHSNNELLTGFAGTDGMKTGYVCSSGLNIVATVTRGGRQLMAVTLGANSTRERGEMTAQMLFSGFAGGYRGTGVNVVNIPNQAGIAPVDMRANICGAGAETYAEQRMEIFSAGLDGQISYLTDTIVPPTHTISTLGRLADVPLPRPRPDMGFGGAPAVAAGAANDNIGFGDSSIMSLTPNAGIAGN
ncbi:D-alanyl-D-alanine carboxypeptidase [Pelagibacterium sp. 26DY04]|uniref:D-alanyl-D-alanine carboxypeptidase family protein n=1 Tax=Pelagibacterium sp. 26DY04 TaxID=2967130 RepID=UPI002814F15B|nr:D-alanyl-D-alanine carboxypeptidase family protein [Pelagibacterium sp. 26DY04]WMT86703.1 D-alanyl-D-alanine carboxypeptidase [Pelagibacterium sp. 26DY04]